MVLLYNMTILNFYKTLKTYIVCIEKKILLDYGILWHPTKTRAEITCIGGGGQIGPRVAIISEKFSCSKTIIILL